MSSIARCILGYFGHVIPSGEDVVFVRGTGSPTRLEPVSVPGESGKPVLMSARDWLAAWFEARGVEEYGAAPGLGYFISSNADFVTVGFATAGPGHHTEEQRREVQAQVSQLFGIAALEEPCVRYSVPFVALSSDYSGDES